MLKRPYSLRVSLVLPYVLLVVVVAAALGGTYFWSASRNISDFSYRHMNQLVTRIGQAVHYHLEGAEATLAIAFPRGMPVDDDIGNELMALRERFWMATALPSSPTRYIYYGNKGGQDLAMLRLSDHEMEMRLKLKPEAHRVYYHYRGMRGLPEPTQTEDSLFDPRTRIWFKYARETTGDFWTPVYIDYTTRNLVVTRGRRVNNASGEFDGAVAADIPLRNIMRFVKRLDVGEYGRAFLVERDGRLLASNSAPVLHVGTNEVVTRIAAGDSSDPVVQAAYEGIVPLLHQADIGPGNRMDERRFFTTVTDDAGDKIDVAAHRIVDDAGLNWLGVVAVPRKASFASLYQQLWIALAIGLLAVVLAIVIGSRIFGRIADDVVSLSTAINHIRNGEQDVSITVNRRDEIGDLAHNFKAMHQELFTDRLTGVANRTALGNLLTTVTRSDTHWAFTLFFIDLNKFKPLNDTYGHDNGDLALIEVAQRLRENMREDDFIARLGGDEFVVIVSNVTDKVQVDALKRKMRRVIETPLTTLEGISPGEVVTLGAAIGTASWPGDAETPTQLVKRADDAMYREKNTGR